MKTLKKVLAITLAFALLLGLSATALAEPNEEDIELCAICQAPDCEGHDDDSINTGDDIGCKDCEDGTCEKCFKYWLCDTCKDEDEDCEDCPQLPTGSGAGSSFGDGTGGGYADIERTDVLLGSDVSGAFTDPVFRDYVMQWYGSKSSTSVPENDQILDTDLAAEKNLEIIAMFLPAPGDIYNLDGLQFFTGLETLHIDGIQVTNFWRINFLQNLTALALTNLPEAWYLHIYNLPNLVDIYINNLPKLDELGLEELPKLTEFALSNLPSLNYISFSNVPVSAWSIPQINAIPSLEQLSIGETSESSLTLSGLTNITYLNISGNENLTSLSISNLPKLENLQMHTMENLASLNVSSLLALQGFGLGDLPGLTGFSLSNLPALEWINFYDLPGLTGFTLSNLPSLYSISFSNVPTSAWSVPQINAIPSLEQLSIGETSESSLTLSGLTNITYLDIYYNDNLTNLSISNLSKLEQLNMNSIENLASLNLSSLPALQGFNLSNMLNLTGFSLANLPALNGISLQDLPGLTGYTLSNLPSLNSISFSNVPTSAWSVPQINAIPSLVNLSIGETSESSLTLSGLTNIESLDVYYNNTLTSLTITGLSKLSNMWFYETDITSLSLNNVGVGNFWVSSASNLTSLALSGSTILESLYLQDLPALTTLSLTSIPALTAIHISGDIPSLPTFIPIINSYPQIKTLGIYDTNETHIDAINLTYIEELYITSNPKLTSIDVSNTPALKVLDVSQNRLASIDDIIGLDDRHLLPPDEFLLIFGAQYADSIADAIANGVLNGENPTIYLDGDSDTTITVDDLLAIKNAKVDLRIAINPNDGMSYEVIIPWELITDSAKEIDLMIDFEWLGEDADLYGVNLPDNHLIIRPVATGEFGFTVRLTNIWFGVSYEDEAEQKAGIFKFLYINSSGQQTDYTGKMVYEKWDGVDDDGAKYWGGQVVSLDITHSSAYALTHTIGAPGTGDYRSIILPIIALLSGAAIITGAVQYRKKQKKAENAQ